MEWIRSFFKVVDVIKERFILEVNPSFVDLNLTSFLKLSNYARVLKEDVDLYIESDNNYDEKLIKLNEIVSNIEKETIKHIKSGEFDVIKYDYFNKYFYMKKDVLEENFFLNEGTGMIKVRPDSKHLYGRNFHTNLEIPKDYTISKQTVKPFPKFSVMTNPVMLNIKNGLSILAETKVKNLHSVAAGIIFDAGNAFANRVSVAKKIISYFKSKGIKHIYCILSHEHMDHYNVFNLKIMRKWLSTIESTAIYYEDIDIASKLSFVSSCKNKIPLRRENRILSFGDVSIKTFKSVVPVPSHKQNEASMVVHSRGTTFSGDQSYENIESSWMIKQSFFQVPHHGSILSGNHLLATDNINAIPSYDLKGLPNIVIEKYFIANIKSLKKF